MIATSSFIEKANFAKAKAFSSTIQNELLFSLVSEWTFDELTSDGKTKDTWGNNHGTVYGAEWVDDCVFGKCYKFNGVADYIEKNGLLANLNSLTFNCWFYPLSIANNQRAVLSFHTSEGQNLNMVFVRNKNLSYYDDSTKYIYSSKSIDKDKWHFLTVEITSNGAGILYLDANSVASFNTGVRPDNGGRFSIGQEWDGTQTTDFFHGLIDDVRIYNSALSSAQIKQNYIAGLDSMLKKGILSKDEYNERLEALASN